MVVDNFLVRQGWNKSTQKVAGTKIQQLAKFFEYCWLNNIYTPVQWPVEMWDQFLTAYRKGSWSSALDLRTRADNAIRDLPLKNILRINGEKTSIRTSLLNSLGTNASCSELNSIRQAIHAKHGLVSCPADT